MWPSRWSSSLYCLMPHKLCGIRTKWPSGRRTPLYSSIILKPLLSHLRLIYQISVKILGFLTHNKKLQKSLTQIGWLNEKFYYRKFYLLSDYLFGQTQNTGLSIRVLSQEKTTVLISYLLMLKGWLKPPESKVFQTIIRK